MPSSNALSDPSAGTVRAALHLVLASTRCRAARLRLRDGTRHVAGDAVAERADHWIAVSDGRTTRGTLLLWGGAPSPTLCDAAARLIAEALRSGETRNAVERREGIDPLLLLDCIAERQRDLFDAAPSIEDARSHMAETHARIRLLHAVHAARSDGEEAASFATYLRALAQRLPEALRGSEASRASEASRGSEALRRPDASGGTSDVRCRVMGADLALPAPQCLALGHAAGEFALAAMRDSFPRPRTHCFDLAVSAEEGHATLEVVHAAFDPTSHARADYDTSRWRDGVPVLASQLAEGAAAQLNGLAAIDRPNGGALRLRIAFDRPGRADGAALDADAAAPEGDGIALGREPAAVLRPS